MTNILTTNIQETILLALGNNEQAATCLNYGMGIRPAMLPPKFFLCSSDGPRAVHGNAVPGVWFVSTPCLQQLLAQPVAHLLNSCHDRLITNPVSFPVRQYWNCISYRKWKGPLNERKHSNCCFNFSPIGTKEQRGELS